jgi:hypothetical protein
MSVEGKYYNKGLFRILLKFITAGIINVIK